VIIDAQGAKVVSVWKCKHHAEELH
jgi:hypothetical protein